MDLRIESYQLNDEATAADRERCRALLSDADPSRANVDDYLKRGELYVARPAGVAQRSESRAPARDSSSATDPGADADRSDIVGLYLNLRTRPLTIEIMNVAVTLDLQGRGIGKQLVAHAIATAKGQGAKAIEIGTGNSGVGQLALYQKAGFRIVGIDFDYFTRFFTEPLYENGIQVRDMIRLAQDL
ncbi:MAG: GNAT family N-acetyltransferase [Leptospirales bacterium]